MELRGRIMPASNATFLAELDGREVVYKPVAGERPLWDFPEGTLADREVAAYLVSEATGWDLVPRTWWARRTARARHGPGVADRRSRPGRGDAGACRPACPEGWFAIVDGVDDRDRDVTLVHEDTLELRRMAVFDVLVNNADRKGGHVLPMPDGHRYGVDHGVTLPPRAEAAHRALGLGRLPAHGTRSAPGWTPYSPRSGATWGSGSRGHLTDLEVTALERRAETAAGTRQAARPARGAGRRSPGHRSTIARPDRDDRAVFPADSIAACAPGQLRRCRRCPWSGRR